MKEFFKLIGGILLITGTSIGGGMLALPIANAEAGFLISSLTLLACWCLMTFSALIMLEVNLWFPSGSNLISMAEKTIGKNAKYVTWIAYMLLLYTLLVGYISGGTDLIDSFLTMCRCPLPLWIDSTLFVSLLGAVVFLGVQSVDVVNRGLMFGKLGVFALLIVLLLPHANPVQLLDNQNKWVAGSLMLLVTSFGFAHIVPSMRAYFNDDVIKIRKVIMIGSFIPLICYILWDAAIMGVLPRFGEMGLIQMLGNNAGIDQLLTSLIHFVDSDVIAHFFAIFMSISMLTAFLGVSLGLIDFLADGMKRTKRGVDAFYVYGVAFIPPLLLVFYKPSMFLVAMSFAGICCIILLVLLPTLMAWYGRYHHKLSGPMTMPGGKSALIILFAVGVYLAILGLKQSLGLL